MTISATTQEMESVQRGELKGDEKYAYDYAHAEDLKESNVQIASWSVEKRDAADDDCLISAKDDPNITKEEYELIKLHYEIAKTNRHRRESNRQLGKV